MDPVANPVAQAAIVAEVRPRPAQHAGAISRVLMEHGLEELFSIRQVGGTRNFVLAPDLIAQESTPWSRLSNYEQAKALVAACDALDKAGYGFAAEVAPDGTVVREAQPVASTFRFVNFKQGSQGARSFAPRIFINAEPFDREGAQLLAQARRTLQDGTTEEKAATKATLRNVAGPTPLSTPGTNDPGSSI